MNNLFKKTINYVNSITISMNGPHELMGNNNRDNIKGKNCLRDIEVGIGQTSTNGSHLKVIFQIENAATAILTSELLRKREPKFSIIANYHGIACAQWERYNGLMF
ncbi:hypothetical protein F8M41_020700 [Gigaspora margarita]|uniref:Uncharacterized protein n=1 Tax=Gigaspora margarita TaxID=4874 RepID=A0A8H4AHY9_GIGMA|nr:hypothetical protein F8M41_020700 [Gigaspora margarita]